jgi:predicted dehydrogenase
MKPPITIGIAGAGAILDHHLEALRLIPGVRVVGIADVDPVRRENRAAELGCAAFPDVHGICATRPTLVLVLLPHHLHHAAAIEALRCGCHVVVEKPMAIEERECVEMLREAARQDVLLAVADAAASVPGAVRTGERVRDGSLGRFLAGGVTNVRWYFDADRPAWFLDPARSGGGMFSNLGVHRLALARTCLPGLVPAAVSASVGRLDARPVEACTTAHVRYAAGGAMQYEEVGYFPRPSWLAAGIHFVFEKGLVSWDDSTWRVQGVGDVREEALAPRLVQYEPFWRGVAAALQGDGPRPSAEGGAMDVAVVRAAYRSAREEREIALDPAAWTVQRPEALTPG